MCPFAQQPFFFLESIIAHVRIGDITWVIGYFVNRIFVNLLGIKQSITIMYQHSMEELKDLFDLRTMLFPLYDAESI